MEPWQSWAAFIVLASCASTYYYFQNNASKHRGRPLQRVSDIVPQFKEEKRKGGLPKAAAKKPKAKKANKKPASDSIEQAAPTSTASSTNGAEADDDLSPKVSPTLPATTAKVASGRDVSDMLEKKGPAPGVLRLTEPAQPVRQKQIHQAKEPAAQETKKQRQNRKKVEEKKLQREQEEKERKALEEKQRRTAREARGEPAKNGLQQAKAPASSAWSAPNVAPKSTAVSNDAPLLDTFDQDAASTTSSSAAATAGTSTTNEEPMIENPWAGVMTEEEQIRLAMEDSEWTTVPKGRKAKKNMATSTDGSDVIPSSRESVHKPVAAPVAAPTPKVQANTSAEAAALYNTSKHPMDSDWPVV